MKDLRKLLALLLALCMLTSMLGTAAFAAGEETDGPQSPICAGLEGCTGETHGESCPLYEAPEANGENKEEAEAEPTEEQPEEPTATLEPTAEPTEEPKPEEPPADDPETSAAPAEPAAGDGEQNSDKGVSPAAEVDQPTLPTGASTEKSETCVSVTGVAGLDGLYFDTVENAYNAFRAILESMGATHGGDALGQGQLQPDYVDNQLVKTAQEKFDEVYTQKTVLPGHDGVKLTWTVYGKMDVPSDPLFLSGGRAAAWYGSDSMTIREIEIVGGNESAELVTNTGPSMPYQWWGDTTDDYISLKIKGVKLSPTGGQLNVGGGFRTNFDYVIEDCTVNGTIYFYFNGTSALTVKGCTFVGSEGQNYAFFAQGHATQPLTVNFLNNTVSGYKRGINIDQVTADVTIGGNTITPGAGYSAIQISGCKTATIENNNIHLNGSNVLTFHENLARNAVEGGRTITFADNTVEGNGYLVYDDIAASGGYNDTNTYMDLTMGGNTIPKTVSTTQGIKGETVTDSKVQPVAEVNGVQYNSLQSAVEACPVDGTVKVLADVSLTGSINPGKAITIEGVTKENGSKPVISGGNGLFSVTRDSATLKNLELQATGNTWYIYQEADLTVDSCDFTMADGVSDVGNLIMDDGHAKVTFTNNKVLAHSRVALAGPGNDSVITNNVFDLVNESYGASRTSVIGLVATADSGSIVITGNVFKNANRVLGVDNSYANVAEKLTFKDNAFIDCRWALELDPTAQGGFDLAENYYSFDNVVGEAKVENAKASGSHTDGSTAYAPAEGETPKVVVSSYYKQYDETNGLSELAVGSGAVAQVGEKVYASLLEALKACPVGGTVTMLDDVELTAQTNIVNKTLDLGGFTITDKTNGYGLVTKDTAVVKNGKIVTNAASQGIYVVSGHATAENLTVEAEGTGIYVNNDATFTLDKDSTVNATSNGIVAYGGTGANAGKDPTLHIYGKINASTAIIGSGNCKTTPGSTINIYEGAEVRATSTAIYHPQMGKLNILGGLVEGYAAIGIKSGILNISGNAVVRGTANDTDLGDQHSNGNGIVTDGSAIVVDTHTSYAGQMVLNISGSATVESAYSYAIREIRSASATGTNVVRLTVSGNAVVKGAEGCIALKDTSVGQISGGIFSHDVGDYCVEGYRATQNSDGTYGVAAIPTVPTTYRVSVTAGEGGSASASRRSAARGATVTVTVTPDEGYELSEITAVTAAGRNVTLSGSDGSYTFTMPSAAVTVTVTFAEAENLEDPDTPLAGALPFEDVTRNDWYFGAISSVYLKELMVGISGTEFGPEMPSNRGTVATILHRMENTPDAGMGDFTDVLAGQWYAPAISWANQTGVMIGYDTGVFQPEGGITREQLALTFYRYYTKVKGGSVETRADLSTFADGEQVSGWAREAMEWAVGCGLLKGTTENCLAPQGATKRSELAAVLQRFLEMK